MWRSLFLAALSSTLLSCASQVPERIREFPAGGPTLYEVRAEPERFKGTSVRWGGVIAAVDNRAEETVIQVVAKDLENSGRPRDTLLSDGRFMARMKGFFDPVVYAPGELLTVVGPVEGVETAKIGEHSYTFPVVRVEQYFLWEPYYPGYYDYPPWYYDRFYYPWYPYPGRYHPYRYY